MITTTDYALWFAPIQTSLTFKIGSLRTFIRTLGRGSGSYRTPQQVWILHIHLCLQWDLNPTLAF